MTIDSTATFEFKLAEAKSVNEVTFFGTYCDTKSGEDLTPILKRTTSNGTTDVQLMASPAASYLRTLTDGKFHNADTIAHTVILMTTISASQVVHYRKYIQPNETAVYPKDFTEIQSLKVLSAKTNGGRTVTTATDTLLITDNLSRVLANYTGTGQQVFTIPKATYAIGDTIKILRIGNQFKIEIEDGAEQTINDECYSGIAGSEVELIYTRDNGGKEEWIVTNGNNYNKTELVLKTYQDILGICENSTYKVTLYAGSSDFSTLSDPPIYSNMLLSVINKSTLVERCIQMQARYLNKGLHYETLSDSVIGITIGYTGSSHEFNMPKIRIGTTGLLSFDLVGWAYNSIHSFNKPFSYKKANVILALTNHNSANQILEYTYSPVLWASSGRTLAISANNGFYSGAWDGVNSTGGGTAYIYVSLITGGLLKLDIDNLSTTTTIAALSQCIFLTETPLNGYLWYIRGQKIGKFKISDNTYTEFSIGLNLVTYGYYNMAMDTVNNRIFVAVIGDYRYVEFNIALETFSIIDVSSDLESGLLRGLSFINSEQIVYLHANKVVESSGYGWITLAYQK